jgi:hypothetical protein
MVIRETVDPMTSTAMNIDALLDRSYLIRLELTITLRQSNEERLTWLQSSGRARLE